MSSLIVETRNEAALYFQANIDNTIDLVDENGILVPYKNGNPIGIDDAFDAFRHAYVSGVFDMELGTSLADALGWVNEVKGDILDNADIASRVMDLHNNRIGRLTSDTATDRTDLADKLVPKLTNGDLIIDPANSPANYNDDIVLEGGLFTLTISITDGAYSLPYAENVKVEYGGIITDAVNIVQDLMAVLGGQNGLLNDTDGIVVADNNATNNYTFKATTNGNDTVTLTDSKHIVDGGDGVDTLDYSGMTEGVDVDMGASNTYLSSNIVNGVPQGAAKDIFDNIENITGSDYADTILGDGQSNVLDGGLGDDILEGGADSDTFIFDSTTSFGADTVIDDGGNIQIDGTNLSGTLTPTTNPDIWQIVHEGKMVFAEKVGADLVLAVNNADSSTAANRVILEDFDFDIGGFGLSFEGAKGWSADGSGSVSSRSIVGLEDGGIAVINAPTSGQAVTLQQYDTDGNTVGGLETLGTWSSGARPAFRDGLLDQMENGEIVINLNGGFHSYTLSGQSGSFHLNNSSIADTSANLTAAPQGGVWMGWDDNGSDYVQLFNASGTAQSSTLIDLSTYQQSGTSWQNVTHLEALPNGGVVVASKESVNGDVHGYVREFDAQGNFEATLMHQVPESSNLNAVTDMTVLDNGKVAVVYEQWDDGNSGGYFGKFEGVYVDVLGDSEPAYALLPDSPTNSHVGYKAQIESLPGNQVGVSWEKFDGSYVTRHW